VWSRCICQYPLSRQYRELAVFDITKGRVIGSSAT